MAGWCRRKLRGYLEELPEPPSADAVVAGDAALPHAIDSSKLRRLQPALSSKDEHDQAHELAELTAAAHRNTWLSTVVRDHSQDLLSASSLLSFRGRQVLLDTRNRRRGTVFLVVEGAVGLIFRSHAECSAQHEGGSAWRGEEDRSSGCDSQRSGFSQALSESETQLSEPSRLEEPHDGNDAGRRLKRQRERGTAGAPSTGRVLEYMRVPAECRDCTQRTGGCRTPLLHAEPCRE